VAIEFSYPLYSLLFLLVGLFAYYFYKKSSLPVGKKVQLLTIRLLVFTFVIFALMGAQAVFSTKNNHFVFLIDRSASVESNDKNTISQINAWKNELNEEDVYSVVTFSQKVAVESLKATKQQDFVSFNQEMEQGETNVEEALMFAHQLIQSSNYNGKIILMTDGNETVGNHLNALTSLSKTNIAVDVVPFATNENEDVSIVDLKTSEILYSGETVHLDAVVASSVETAAILDWKVNHELIASTPVQLQKGNNTFRYNYETKETGFINFTVEVQAAEEAYKENNQMSAISVVKSTPKILVVYENENYLTNYLTSNDYLVDTVHVNQLPTTLTKLLEYKSIVFENTSGVSISSAQMELIHQAVYDYGVGFVMTGGENSFGLGGYFQTPIEQLLPVHMDIKGQKELPSLGLVILVDRSGSMSGGKLELAKEAAVRSVEMLREEDTFGFIAFDDQPWQIVETGPIDDKDEVISLVSSVSLGGGTDFQESLSMAINQLANEDVQRKHIILLTDGQAPTQRVSELVQEAVDNNISLSTVAVGADADQNSLNNIAQTGNGRYYFVQDATVIPTILSRETAMMTRTYIEDEPFYPTIVGSSFMNGLVVNGVPQMNAYIATSLKNGAKLNLLSEKEDPVFASWQYGLGTTVAFTSDMTGQWSGDWAKWNNWQSFLDSMIKSSFLSMETQDLATTFKKKANEQVISVQTNSSQFGNVVASLVSDNGEKINISPAIKGVGNYEITIPSKEGIYYLNVSETLEDGTKKNYLTGFTIPYSEEYTPKKTNWHALETIHTTTNGVLISEQNDFVPQSNSHKKIMQPLTKYLLLLAFFLFFLEIAMRRFNWFIPSVTLPKLQKTTATVTKKEQSLKSSPITETTKNRKQEEKKQDTVSQEKTKQEKLNELLNATKRK